MMRAWYGCAAAAFLSVVAIGGDALAQKQGGILRVHEREGIPTMSIHEEGTISTVLPMMGVFNNLVVYDPKVPQNSLKSIIPDLATGWAWSEDNKSLTFKLRTGVTWHDGKPFTSADVKCTWDLLTGKAKEGFRLNFRAGWYHNLGEVTTEGADTAIFHLKRPQPAFLALLASGFTPVYPCHVSPAEMRRRPIGTGPFKFVEYKTNQSLKVERNPTYWKTGRPYLDGIEYTVIPNRSTAILSFVAGKVDMLFPYEVTIPLLKDVKSQVPDAHCEIGAENVAPNMLINPVPPFDKPELRRAMALTLDRKAYIDILGEGKGDMGGAMLPPPEGLWGLPPEILKTLPGFDPDVKKSREEARTLMRGLGFGPDKHLPVKVSARNLAVYRDPAAILIDQLKEIWIDGELESVETAQWVPKLVRRDYQVAVSLVGNGVDEPDQQFYESYVCGSRTYMDYCNKEIDGLVEAQSSELDQEKRKKLVWEIDRRLQQDVVRPMLYFRRNATCWRPEVKGISLMANSIYNGWRMDEVWLDK
jgi:peptide/nickel transport system substrate-binding protein